MNNLAYLYGRVSTDKQTVATQEARGREYIDYKRFILSADFYDDDVSGSIPLWERPAGGRMRQALELSRQLPDPNRVAHLVVVRLDRLGRSAVDLLRTLEYLDSINVILHVVDLGGDALSSQGASGRLMFTVLAGMAEFERELIRDRIKDKLDNKRSQNELTGTVPYGWDAVETGAATAKGVKLRELVPNPAEQQWILHMVQLRSLGYGYHSIANDLNSRGVPTKHGCGDIMRLRVRRSSPRADEGPSEKRFTTGKWQSGNVAKVLKNKTVTEWLASREQQAA